MNNKPKDPSVHCAYIETLTDNIAKKLKMCVPDTPEDEVTFSQMHKLLLEIKIEEHNHAKHLLEAELLGRS